MCPYIQMRVTRIISCTSGNGVGRSNAATVLMLILLLRPLLWRSSFKVCAANVAVAVITMRVYRVWVEHLAPRHHSVAIVAVAAVVFVVVVVVVVVLMSWKFGYEVEHLAPTTPLQCLMLDAGCCCLLQLVLFAAAGYAVLKLALVCGCSDNSHGALGMPSLQHTR